MASSSSEWTPSEPTRPMSACRTSTVARASDRARWLGTVPAWKCAARVESLQLRTSSRSSTARARRAVSTTTWSGQGRPSRAHAPLRKETSYGALWATRTAPVANSRNAGTAAASDGASTSMESVMPVRTAMNGGTGMPGCTRVWNSPTTSPARTFTAPISVIPASPGEPPVVSRSTTTNVTCDSGVPRSSKVRWPTSNRSRGSTVGGSRRGRCIGLTSPTLGGGYDGAGQARRRRVVATRYRIARTRRIA